MSVRVYGISKLDENYYDGIFIKQYDKRKFRVDVSGKESEELLVSSSVKLSSEIKGKNDVDKISMIVDHYLRSTKITELTFPTSDKCYSGVYGDRKLELCICDSEMSCVYQAITDKYIQDRWNFCVDNANINNVKISIDEDASYYGLGKGYGDSLEFITFGLKYFRNTGELEQDFITRYLYDRFSMIGKKIEVFPVYNGCLNSKNDHIIYYVFECGDLRVYVPDDKRIMFLYKIAFDYNQKLGEIEENVKKRQLKMEGF